MDSGKNTQPIWTYSILLTKYRLKQTVEDTLQAYSQICSRLSIDHNILLTKLEIQGIRGVALQWFASYLSDRTQLVAIAQSNSSTSLIKCGVPQRSVLGPLLFIIYINDIIKSTTWLKFVLFADDTNLFASHINLEILIDQINKELINVSTCLKINNLSQNVSKTNFIVFHNRQTNIDIAPKINIDSNLIKQVRSTKFVRVIINENLTWLNHMSIVLNKTNKNVGVIRRLSKLLPIDVLHTLYNVFIAPYLDYCNIAWSVNDTVTFVKLFRMQKQALRVISGKD